MNVQQKSLELLDRFFNENDKQTIDALMDKYDKIEGESISVASYFTQSSRNNWLGQCFEDEMDNSTKKDFSNKIWTSNGTVVQKKTIRAKDRRKEVTVFTTNCETEYDKNASVNIQYAA